MSETTQYSEAIEKRPQHHTNQYHAKIGVGMIVKLEFNLELGLNAIELVGCDKRQIVSEFHCKINVLVGKFEALKDIKSIIGRLSYLFSMIRKL